MSKGADLAQELGIECIISVQKAPLPEHERYKAVPDKLQFLDRKWV